VVAGVADGALPFRILLLPCPPEFLREISDLASASTSLQRYDLRRMPNENHELPAVHIVITRIAKCRHSAQVNTVGVVEFAIGHLLRILLRISGGRGYIIV
jgi:hypothetical protein